MPGKEFIASRPRILEGGLRTREILDVTIAMHGLSVGIDSFLDNRRRVLCAVCNRSSHHNLENR